MEKTFVNPNLHVALVHFPIALLISGTLIELFSFMWRRHGFRAAGRWMILIGALSSIPTAMAGVYALCDVAMRTGNVPDGVPWREVAAESKLSAQQWHFLADHTWLESEATLLAVFVVVLWIACSDLWRRRLHLPFLALLLVAVGLTLSGAWHGGEAVYRFGTAVDPLMGVGSTGGPKPFVVPTTDPASAATAPTTNMAAATTGAAQAESVVGALKAREQKVVANVKYYVPPLQTHVVLAGAAVAIALASLGLSVRKITQGPPVTQVDHIAAALGGPATLLGGEADEDIAGAGGVAHLPPASGADPIDIAAPVVPASRFWLLAFLLGLTTAACGAWVLADRSSTWVPRDLWLLVADRDQNGGAMITRRLAHVIAGVSITVIPILLAALARWAPRKKWLLTIFTVLLIAAIAAQVWLGVLMLYDGTQGGVRAFN